MPMLSEGDILKEDEAVQFFKDCLREEGFDDVDVAHSTTAYTDEFYVRKVVGDEQLAFNVSFDFDTLNDNPDVIRKKIANRAEEVARAFRDNLLDIFDWGGRTVHVCIKGDTWAQCQHCDTKVRLPRVPQTVFSDAGEITCPNPLPRRTNSAHDALSGRERQLLKLYLLGLLRQNCDYDCRNNIHSPTHNSPGYMDAYYSATSR